MARYLIIACGCRGGELARALVSRGHTVRGTARSQSRVAEMEAAGAQPFIADPDRVATLIPPLEHVTVVYLLLGSARGERQQLEALHGTRLVALLHRLIDTTVRGVVYEVRGSVPAEILATGSERVKSICGRSRLPYVLLDAPPEGHREWLAAALAAGDRLVS